MQVEQFLEYSAQRYPDKAARISGDDRYTYRQIDEEANRLGHALIASGVQRGDRVVIFLPNSFETVVSIFVTLKAGAVFVVLNSTTKPDKLTYILNNCRASVMVTSGAKANSCSACWAETPYLQSVFTVGASESQANAVRSAGKQVVALEEVRRQTGNNLSPAKKCIDIDLAALIYTSGSTGRPKGVMVTHLNIVSAATSISSYLENTSDDIVINFLPLGFDYGLYQLLMMFKMGGTLVLHDSFAFPNVAIDKMIREKA